MQIGMIGLGRMGANMVRRLVRAATNAWPTTARPEAVRGGGRRRRARRAARSRSSSRRSSRRARCGSWCLPAVDDGDSRSCARSLRRRRADRRRQLPLPR